MQKLDLVIDLGTSFLKIIAFFPEGKGLRVFKFSKVDYNPIFLKDLEKKVKKLISDLKGRYDFGSLLIGAGEGIGKGKIEKGNFLRKFPLVPLREEELKESIKNIQKKSLYEVERTSRRKKFFLVLAKIENVSIDGRKVSWPVGLTGRSISFKIINFYLPLELYQSLNKIFHSFNIERFFFEYIPEILPDFLSDYTGKDRSELGRIGSKIKFFIDIGGKNSQVLVLDNGEVEKITEITLGGNDLLRRIQNGLKVTPEEIFFKVVREKIEFEIKKTNISYSNQQRIIQEILETESQKWLEELMPILEEYRREKSPFEIYFFGGGSNFLLLDKINKELARKSFSCIIKKISPINLKGVFNFTEDDLQMTIPLLVCKTLLRK